MHENVFKTIIGLFCELQVEPDTTCLGVAASPFCFHLLDTPAATLLTDLGLPLFEE